MRNKYVHYIIGGILVLAFLGAFYYYASNHREYAHYMIA